MKNCFHVNVVMFYFTLPQCRAHAHLIEKDVQRNSWENVIHTSLDVFPPKKMCSGKQREHGFS